jgi:hypothetical protein
MTPPSTARTTETPLTRDLFDIARYYLFGRRGLLVMAVVAVAVGLAFNWSWMVAAGIAPLLLSALPCVAMCALGLCMRGMGGRSCSADTTAQQMPDSTTTIDRISDVPASDPAAQTNVHLETPQERKHEDA